MDGLSSLAEVSKTEDTVIQRLCKASEHKAPTRTDRLLLVENTRLPGCFYCTSLSRRCVTGTLKRHALISQVQTVTLFDRRWRLGALKDLVGLYGGGVCWGLGLSKTLKVPYHTNFHFHSSSTSVEQRHVTYCPKKTL